MQVVAIAMWFKFQLISLICYYIVTEKNLQFITIRNELRMLPVCILDIRTTLLTILVLKFV